MLRIYLVLLTSLLTTISTGQIAFEQVHPLPPALTNIADFDDVTESSVAFADIDNDNDLDMLITGDLRNPLGSAIAKLYINDGNGNYTEEYGTPFIGISRGSVAFADIDNDNDLDVLISGRKANTVSSTKLYTNDGNGTFTIVTDFLITGVQDCSIAFADIDNDNDQDLLITGRQWSPAEPITKLYTNDGNGFFIEKETPIEGVVFSAIAFADIDNDNDQDVLITGNNGSGQGISKLYTNDGNGNFLEVAETPFVGVQRGSIAFADVDNDSDQDLLITGAKDNSQSTAKLYINDGNGIFEELIGTPFDGVYLSAIAFSDIDNDNDEDVIITGSYADFNGKSKLYLNDGTGSFVEVPTPFDGVYYSAIAIADIDNDNDQDVVISGSIYSSVTMTKLYINDGTGSFTEVTGTPIFEIAGGAVAFADVDQDDDQDVIITGGQIDQAIAKLYTNDGNGNYTEVIGTPFEGLRSSAIAFADIDNDGDQDVLMSGDKSSFEPVTKLFKNNGNGIFTEVPDTPFEWVFRGSIAFADIDNDNDQDVLITGDINLQVIAFLYTNDGNGNFELVSETPFVGVKESSIAFADIDNDNDQDVLITGALPMWEPISKLYINDGIGNFTEVTETPFDQVSHSSIAFADIDSDNDQDVLITGDSESVRISKLYTNDGNGNFEEVLNTPFERVGFSSIAFSDIDNDDDQDVLITGLNESWQRIAKLYTNDGFGSFTEFTDTPFEGVRWSSIAFSDIDNDNDPDVLITGQTRSGLASSILYRNVTIPTAIKEESSFLNSLSVYPNPNQGIVNIDLGNLKKVSIKVFSISGKLIYHKQNITTPIHQFNFNKEPGVYIVEVSAQNKIQRFKLVKQ